MKPERLYTLSQFVDLNKLSSDPTYFKIVKYNDFLKQPLTEKIIIGNDAILEGFKEWKIGYFEFNEGEHVILITGNGWYYGSNRKSYIDIPIKTLSDLAEATNGQLKLKNVEI